MGMAKKAIFQRSEIQASAEEFFREGGFALGSDKFVLPPSV